MTSLSNIELTRFLFAIVLLLAFSSVFGYLFKRFLMPRVTGEIFGGILLGPTLLGYFFPQAYTWLFNAFTTEGKLISALYWLGLVLLMFISGFEIEKSLVKKDIKLIAFILFGGTLIPFIIGVNVLKVYNMAPYIGTANNLLAFLLIIGAALAVTSIPVISKIFIDLKMQNTRFAKIVIATATIEDVLLWIAISIATGVVSTHGYMIGSIVWTVFITVMFFLAALLLMPRLFSFVTKLRINYLLKSSALGYVLFVCFFFSALASILNINVIFGAFLAGIISGSLGDNDDLEDIKMHIKEVSLAFFIPIYFSVVGLRLDLIHHFSFRFFLFFLLFASAIKLIGTFIGARSAGSDRLSSFNFAVAMNARGGPGIVIATVAFDLGIISETFFVTLIMLAITTSLLTGFWFSVVKSKGWQLLSPSRTG